VLLAELGLAFITGVCVSAVLSVPTFAVVSVSAVCAGSAWFSRRRHTWVWWLIVCAFALGTARHAGTKSHPGIHDIAHYTGRTVQMVSSVLSEPDVRDTEVSYLVSVDHLITGGASEIVSGKVRVRVSRSVEWGYGDRLTLRARLDPAISLPPDVAGVMQFPHVLSRRPVSSGFGEWITSIRRRFKDSINAWLPEPEAALLIAVAIGAHTAALGDLGKPLIASGLIHVIAISGIKVALVAGMLYRRENFAPPGGSHDLDASVVVTFAALLKLGTASALTPTHALGTTVQWLGSGNSLLVQSVGNTMLIDGSSKPMALLERLGAALPTNAHEIGSIVVTDPRASNVAALREVLRHYRVGEVLDVGAQYPSLLYAQWRHDLRRRAFPAFALRAGARVTVGRVQVVALAPDATCSLPIRCSGVVRLDLPGTPMVVATGAGSRQQHELVFNSGLRTVGEVVLHSADGYDAAFAQSLRGARVFSDSHVPSLPTYVLHPAAPRVLYPQS